MQFLDPDWVSSLLSALYLELGCRDVHLVGMITSREQEEKGKPGEVGGWERSKGTDRQTDSGKEAVYRSRTLGHSQ